MVKFWNNIKAFFSGLFAEVKNGFVKATAFVDEEGHRIEAAAVAEAVKAGKVIKTVETNAAKVIQLWDDKRTFGFLWIVLSLLMPFLFPGAHLSTMVSTVAIGFALYLGIPLGDSVPFIGALESQGILDLITNKANKGDGLRFFGILFQFVAWGYLFAPMVNPAVQFHDEVFLFFGGVGVVMAWAAIWGDHAAVQATLK